MMVEQSDALKALLISVLAVGVWLSVAFRVIGALRGRDEQRMSMLFMPVVGVIVALGVTFSALGYSQQTGLIPHFTSSESLTFLASMGRGGLLMGGLIFLAAYHPHKRERHG